MKKQAVADDVRLSEAEVNFCEQFASEHGLPALLDHLGLDTLGNYAKRTQRANELDDRFGRIEVTMSYAGNTYFLGSEIFDVLDLEEKPIPPVHMCKYARDAWRNARDHTEDTISLYGWQGMIEAVTNEGSS